MSGQGHQDEALTRALRAVAEDDERLGASGEVEARLIAEAHVIARAHGARRLRHYAAAGVLAAVLLVAIAVPAWRTATGRPSAVDATGPSGAGRSPGPAQSFALPQPDEVATEFFPLMYSNVPVANGHTIRVELPQAALTSFGLEADDASGTVLADVLVGQDGLARAVRFVRPASKKEQVR
jgi:hypothetical protein